MALRKRKSVPITVNLVPFSKEGEWECVGLELVNTEGFHRNGSSYTTFFYHVRCSNIADANRCCVVCKERAPIELIIRMA